MSWAWATNFLHFESPTKVKKPLTVSVLTNKHTYRNIMINQNLINKALHKRLIAFGNPECNHTFPDTSYIKWTTLWELFRVWNENIEWYNLSSWSHINTDVLGEWRVFQLPGAHRYSMMSLLFFLFQVTWTYFRSPGLSLCQLLHPRTCHIPCWMDIDLDLSVAQTQKSSNHIGTFPDQGLLLTFDLPKLLLVT